MAVQRVGIQFDFNANTKQAEANLNALEKTMMRVENRLRTMGAPRATSGGIGDSKGRFQAENNLANFGQEQIDLKTPIRQVDLLSESIRKGKMGWHDYGRAVKQNAAIATQQLAVQTGQINNVRMAGRGLVATFTPNSMLTGISGLEVLTKRMTTLGEATRAVSQHTIDMGKNLAFSARQMTVSLTMPMAIVGGLAIKQFTDIDKQLTDIAKVYDLNADGVEMSVGRIRSSMKDLAMELSRTQGAEIKDSLDLAQFYAQQGKTGDVLRQSTVQASRLMMLGDVDKDDAQKTITTLTAVVGASVKELGKYVDYLNKVEDSTQLTMSDFAKTLPTIAPLVKTFIPDDKDALMSTSASMMEISRRAGFDPKESMNAWKSMYGSFVRPTKLTEKEFSSLTAKYGQRQDLGDIVRKHSGNPVDILAELSELTSDWDVTDKGNLMTRLTGKWQLGRGLGFMNAMDDTNPANADALGRMKDINQELVNNPEALADNSKRQMDMIVSSAHNQMQRLKQDAQMLFADLGERIFLPVMEALGKVLEVVKTVYQGIASLPGPVKDMLSGVAQIAFIAGPILAALAATKVLSGFAGRMASNFTMAAANAARIGGSLLGVNMKGSRKIESRDQSIAKIQEKDSGVLNFQMRAAIAEENSMRAETVALAEQKNAKIREGINLQRELNRAQSGTVTATGTPAKDPKKHLKQYQASLQTADRSWNMPIQAKNLGPESFRRHVGRIGAPATSVAGIGLADNKVFGSVAPLTTDPKRHVVPMSMIHKTDATNAGIASKDLQFIRSEIDKINSGIAIRKSQNAITNAKIEDLRAQRPGAVKPGARNYKAINQQRASIDDQIVSLKRSMGDGTIAGQKSYGIEALETQRAALIKAANGNHIQQAKVVSNLHAAQNANANANKQAAMATANATKKRSMMDAAAGGTLRAIGAAERVPGAVRGMTSSVAASAGRTMQVVKDPLGAVGSRMNFFSDQAPPPTFQGTRSAVSGIKRGAQKAGERVVNQGRSIGSALGVAKEATGERSRINRETAAQRKRVWDTNTIRGGQGNNFRGHITPKNISDTQGSAAFRKIKKALNGPGESADIASIIEENEKKRQAVFDKASNKLRGTDPSSTSEQQRAAGQAALDKAKLPTQASLKRQTDIYSQGMVQRADALEKRQEAIAAGSAKWASNVSNAAMGIGMVGTLATSVLGVQNDLVDGALAFANTLGAVGMIMPGIVEKGVAGLAGFGSKMIDKIDAKTAGTKLGALLGDTMGSSLSARLSGVASKMGAALMTATPYILAAGAALLAVKAIWDIHRRDSEAYVENLREANKSVELHAELLGYVRKEQEDLNDMDYEEATTIRARRYRENEDGKSNFINEIRDENVAQTDATARIKSLNAILGREAIRILGDGGSQADVRSMVDAALEAAGVTDDKTITGVKVHMSDFEVTADTVVTGQVREEMERKWTGEGIGRSSGDRLVNFGSGLNPFSADNNSLSPHMERVREYAPRDSRIDTEARKHLERAYRRPTADNHAFIEKNINLFRDSMAGAKDGEEAAIATDLVDMWSGGVEEAVANFKANPTNSKAIEELGAALRAYDQTAIGALENSDSGFAQHMLTDEYERLKESQTLLKTVLGGADQVDYDTPQEAGDKYRQTLKELGDQGIDVSDKMKLFIYNATATAGGMKTMDESVLESMDLLDQFEKQTAKTSEGIDTAGFTAQQWVDHWSTPDPKDLERLNYQIGDVNEELANSPDSFYRRFMYDIQVTGIEDMQSMTSQMRTGMEAGMQSVARDAAAQFKDRQDATMDAIKSETDGAMKSLDAQQKASQKAFAARGKALDAQFKAENKALSKRQNDENKEFAKKQKLEDRAYQKQEKDQKKAFSEQQKEERKVFDKSWDTRGKSIENYYDSAVKSIENQGKAEEKLEQMRQRNAERERKRRQYLADMANNNIDINVAVAGGNLDEAARLANAASAASTDYYQDQIDTEAGYAMQDRGDSRQNRVNALGESRGHSMEHFGEIRDDAGETFGKTQEKADEAKEEELQLARDLYDEKKALEAEQFAEQQELERERLQEAQERQREALQAEQEAIQERHNAEREMIQETARQKEEGARKHFEATQRSLDMELQALMAAVPTSMEGMQDWVNRIEGVYDRHGIYLGEDFAPSVQDDMMKAVTFAMATSANEIQSNAAWNGIGENIGQQLLAGTLAGYLPHQIAASVIFGMPLGPGALNSPFSESNSILSDLNSVPQNSLQQSQELPPLPHKATGGAISGPGTGTSDSILAMLSNGEHVITAKEVQNIGGHKAVERLRKLMVKGKVPGFATGGGVGTSATTPGAAADSKLNVQVASTGAGTVADGGVMSAVASDVSNMGSAFDEAITNTVAPAWQMFGDTMVKVKKDSIDPVLEGSKEVLADYAAQTNQIMAANLNPAWVQFGQNLKMVKDTVFDVVMNEMKAGMSSLSSSISMSISNEIMPKWTEGSDHIRTMQDTVIGPTMQQTQDATTQTAQNFGTAADMIGTGWGRVKENSAEPVRYTIGTVFNDGLVGMWNNVAEALDLDKMTKHEFSFATGGVMPGYTPGRDVHHFTSPTGGKLHLSGGEAIMRPEWTRAVGGEAAVHRMNAQAKSGNYSFHEGGVAPENFEPDRRHLRQYQTHEDHFDEGGVFRVNQSGGNRLAQTPLSTPFNQRLWDIVRTIAPGMSLTSTEVWRPSGAQRGPHHGTGHAIDVSDGGAQMPTATTSGVAKFFYENYGPALTELIHWPLNGWQNVKNGAPLNYDAGTNAGHANHVHLAAHTVLPDPGGAIPMFAGLGVGSLGGMDPAILAAVNQFNEQKDQLRKDIEKHIQGGPDTIMKAIPGKIFSGMTDGMQKKIMEVMPMAGAANLGAYGLNHMDHVKEIIAAAKERGLPKTAAKIAIATALVESELRMYANHAVPESLSFPHEAIGSDHDSVGLFQQRNNGAWGTVAQRMNARASAGLFYNRLVQIPGWQTMDPGAAAQKVQVSAFPEKYAPRMGEALALMERAGGWDSVGAEGAGGGPESDKKKAKKSGDDPSNWFDRGGIASGTGSMTKGVISPERVLSPRQTQAFEGMIPAINRIAEGGISEDQYMAKHTGFDRDAAFKKMIERKSQAEIDFTEILEKVTPILTQIVGQVKGMVVPGITGYATDLIKLENDSLRIDKIATDIVDALSAVQVPEINTDMQFNVGGNIYGDAQLNAILEQWKRQTILEVQAQQALAQQAIGGK